MTGLLAHLGRHLAVARAALAEEKARPRLARRGFEQEFLPAAIELLERPASPAGRAVMLTICLFFVLALLWASLGQVDIVASAPGRIIPVGHTKLIQPLEMGVVRAIAVQNGDRVTRGQVLVEIDPTDSAADRERLHRDAAAARLDMLRLRALLAGPEPLRAFAPPADSDPALVEGQRRR